MARRQGSHTSGVARTPSRMLPSRVLQSRMALSRMARTLGLVIAVLWAAPRVAGATTVNAPSHLGLAHTTLALARQLHWAQLRVAGAQITRDRRLHLQQASNDCALAVVEQLQTMRHKPLPDRGWLARTLALDASGVSLERLAATLRTLGWSAHVVRAAPAHATATLPLPAITLMRPGHFVLVTGRTSSQVEYFDPLVGLVLHPLPDFEARWTGKSVQLSARDN